MVKRVIGIMTGKISSMRAAAFWLAAFSSFSLILGFLRDRLLAHFFGAGTELDIYYAAFKIPDVLFVTAASLVSASILVPVFIEKRERSDLSRLINSVFSSFSVLIVGVCLAGYFLMPYLVDIFFGSLNGLSDQVTFFSRIMLLSPLFLGFSNFFGSIIQFEKRFILYSLSPLLYNLGIIGGLLIGGEGIGIGAAVWGVAVGALAHMLVQAVFVFRSPESPRLSPDIFGGEVRRLFALSLPRTFSLSAVSLSMLFLVSIASKLEDGSIALFSLAFNLQSVLLSLIGVSFSMAAFPTLAEHWSRNEMDKIISHISAGLRQIIFWSLPLAGLFIVLRAHIVRVVLGSGSFNWFDTRMTAAVLAVFVVSTVFQSAQLFLTRAHYAFGNTKIPLLMNLSGAALTVFLAYLLSSGGLLSAPLIHILSLYLKVPDLPRAAVLILPLSFSIGVLLSSLLLYFSMPKPIVSQSYRLLTRSIRDSLFASLIIIAATALALRAWSGHFVLDTLQNVFLHGFLSGLVGLAAAVGCLYWIDNKELKEIVKNG